MTKLFCTSWLVEQAKHHSLSEQLVQSRLQVLRVAEALFWAKMWRWSMQLQSYEEDIIFGRRSHLRLSRVSNCFPFLRLQSSRQSVLRTWKTSSKKKVLDASRNWSKISTSDSHIVDEFGELYFNFQQHVPDLWLLLLKVEEKDAKNELQSPFLRFLVANEHKLPLLLVRRKCRRKGC